MWKPLNIFAGGLTTFLLRTIFQVKGSFSDPRIVPLPTITIPGVKDIPVLGHLLSGNTLLVYISWILVPVCWYLIYKTPWGFHLRASGEYPVLQYAAVCPRPRLGAVRSHGEPLQSALPGG